MVGGYGTGHGRSAKACARRVAKCVEGEDKARLKVVVRPLVLQQGVEKFRSAKGVDAVVLRTATRSRARMRYKIVKEIEKRVFEV